ncbi:PilX N-terminal domain-containing pilus assembly protein [uncultured Thiodictyon sp.]|uniref:PilX N-terminal domain-containing pilus assembly protein n=1 Tax=uncultured Thiodictyon sp. TaxID=1846217 RepID=UPI0025D9F176|nr:PilX N-terminal domain-containing pilus assembly protein [uncultured Thiodictyon sp.]
MIRPTTGKQRGAVLVISLVLLVMLTLLTVTAQNLSTTNLKTVGNMQFRDEAIAAANRTIAQVLSSPFTTNPVAQSITVDIDNDGDTDYVVAMAQPQCLSAAQAGNAAPSSLSLGTAMTSQTTWTTLWDLDASVGGTNAGGAVVRVHCGVRVLLSESEKTAACP